MKYTKIITIALTLSTLGSCKTSTKEIASNSSGYSRVSSDSLRKNYVIFAAPDEKLFSEFIAIRQKEGQTRKDAIQYSQEEQEKLAKDVLMVANALGLDPLLFASLLSHESWFRSSKCNSNGCSLPQLTNSAIHEVNDQISGKKGTYSKDARQYIEEVTSRPPLNSYFNKITTKNRNAQIANNPISALIYGGLLLKIYMANTLISESGYKDITIGDIAKLYHRGMVRYNGNKKTNKNGKRIMDLYPGHVAEQAHRILEKVSTQNISQENINKILLAIKSGDNINVNIAEVEGTNEIEVGGYSIERPQSDDIEEELPRKLETLTSPAVNEEDILEKVGTIFIYGDHLILQPTPG